MIAKRQESARRDTLPREAGLWVGAACAGLAGGLAYKHWATKEYGGQANRLVAEAKRAATAGDNATACARYEQCLERVRTRGGAHQRFGEATAVRARAAASAALRLGDGWPAVAVQRVYKNCFGSLFLHSRAPSREKPHQHRHAPRRCHNRSHWHPPLASKPL